MFTRQEGIALGGITAYSAKSALFSALSTDRGTFFDCTGSFTITLDTTNMAAGWSAWFRNVSGTQTLDPSGATLINGAANYAVSNAGDVVLVEYTGSAFVISHSQRPSTVAITGGTINGTPIGGSTPAAGAFTTLTANGATTLTAGTASTSTITGTLVVTGGAGVSGTIFAGNFNTGGQYTSTVATGTAPFVVASTTVVGNLNVSQLLGFNWVTPGTIGSTTKNTGAFTTLTANGATTLTAATASTSTTTGTLVVTGGVGVSGAINTGGNIGVNAFIVHSSLDTDRTALIGSNGLTGTYAGIYVFGKSHASLANQIYLDASGHFLRSASGSNWMTLDGTTVAITGAATISTTLAVTGTSTLGGDIIWTQSNTKIRTNQADGSDSSFLSVCGGGADGTGRGGTVRIYGNDQGGAGAGGGIYLLPGTGTDGVVYILAGVTPGTPSSTQIFAGNGILKVGGTTASTSTTTGALIVSGGVGIAGATSVGGKVFAADSIVYGATSIASGATSLYLKQVANAAAPASGSGIRWVHASSDTDFFQVAYDTSTALGLNSNSLAFYSTQITAMAFAIDRNGKAASYSSFVVGTNSALATNATDGFLYLPSCAGTPTGTPTAITGKIPLVYDSTNNFLYVYNGGWKKSTVYA